MSKEPIQKLEEKLSTGIVLFNYRKKNGEVRYAAGTIHSDLIPSAKAPKNASTFLHPKTGNANYYDLLAGDWRSFNPSELIRINSSVAKK